MKITATNQTAAGIIHLIGGTDTLDRIGAREVRDCQDGISLLLDTKSGPNVVRIYMDNDGIRFVAHFGRITARTFKKISHTAGLHGDDLAKLFRSEMFRALRATA